MATSTHARFALLAAASLLAACDGYVPAQVPGTAVKPLEGKAVAGPFLSIQEWCKTLKATDCQARDDIVGHIQLDAHTTSTGSRIEIVTAAWRDESLQRGVVLLKRGEELFALPQVIEYNPNDGKRHEATVTGLQHFDDEDPNLVHVVYTIINPFPTEKHPDGTEAREIHDLCSVEAGKPIRCARVSSAITREWPGAKKGEWSSATTIVMIKGLTMEIAAVVPDGPDGDSLAPEIVQPAKYQILFP